MTFQLASIVFGSFALGFVAGARYVLWSLGEKRP